MSGARTPKGRKHYTKEEILESALKYKNQRDWLESEPSIFRSARGYSKKSASKEDKDVLGHLMLLAGKIAEELGLDETFRLVVNNGAKAGQSVFHLHLHLLSGRPLNWPPG